MRSPKTTARVTGALYLGIFALGIYAELFVRQGLIVSGDAAITADNILAAESMFRLALLADLIRHTLLILLPLALYLLLKPVNRSAARLMVALGLIGVPIAMLNMLNHFAALLLLGGAEYLSAFGLDQLHAAMMFFFQLFERGALIGQFLGLWLLPLGYLVFKSGFLPRILGILLMIGSLCYVADVVLSLTLPGADLGLGLLAFIGELLFALWLVIRGVDVEIWVRGAAESA